MTYQFEKLFNLKDGWLDGDGKAPDHNGLNWLVEQSKGLTGGFYVYPTPEGRVLIEWDLKFGSASLEVSLDTQCGIFMLDDVISHRDTAMTLQLTPSNISLINSFLSCYTIVPPPADGPGPAEGVGADAVEV